VRACERADAQRDDGEQSCVSQRHERQRQRLAGDEVEVARRELELGEDRGGRHRGRHRVHPPRERERTEREDPDQELRRKDLPEDDERGYGGERGENEASRLGPSGREQRQQRHDAGEQREKGSAHEPVGPVHEPVRAVACDGRGVADARLVEGEERKCRSALDLHRTV
jgi:hypothetical protein